jgi:hypothetical protein
MLMSMRTESFAPHRSGLYIPRDYVDHVGQTPRRFFDPKVAAVAALAERLGVRQSLGWVETLINATGDGPALTAAAAASAIQTRCKLGFPSNFFDVGKMLKVQVAGRISNAVTTPGTARFDLRLGATVVFDTGALNLNTVAKTNVPFWLEIVLTCRAGGPTANFIGIAIFESESVVGSPANTAGSNGSLLAPVGAPAVGNNFDATTALALDMFFTQTVATGSMTVHQYAVISLN